MAYTKTLTDLHTSANNRIKHEIEASEKNNEIVKNENSGDLRNVPTIENQKTYVCEYCGKPYTHQQYVAGLFNRHVRIVHEGIKDFKCHLCGNKFSERGSLAQHIRCIHNGEKNAKCEICGKAFRDKGYLRMHLKSVHQKLKEHKCDKCGKAFSQERNLKEHIAGKHEGDIKCEECHKDFSTLGQWFLTSF